MKKKKESRSSVRLSKIQGLPAHRKTISMEVTRVHKKSSKKGKEVGKVIEIKPKKSFTLLVRRGLDDFPSKVTIETNSIVKLQSKLQKMFKCGPNTTLLYYDSDFNEYIRFPSTVIKMPSMAKILIEEK